MTQSTGGNAISSSQTMRPRKNAEIYFADPDHGQSIPTLENYLAECWPKRWRYGAMDCCKFSGGWVKYRTGRDPFAAVPYDDERGAYALIKKHRSLVGVVDYAMASVGIFRTLEPEYGDLGVVTLPRTVARVAGGSSLIFDGRWWICKELDGFSYSDQKDVVAWRVV